MAIGKPFADFTNRTCAKHHLVVFIVDVCRRIGWVGIFRVGKRWVVGVLRQDAGETEVDAGACERGAWSYHFGRQVGGRAAKVLGATAKALFDFATKIDGVGSFRSMRPTYFWTTAR